MMDEAYGKLTPVSRTSAPGLVRAGSLLILPLQISLNIYGTNISPKYYTSITVGWLTLIFPSIEVDYLILSI